MLVLVSTTGHGCALAGALSRVRSRHLMTAGDRPQNLRDRWPSTRGDYKTLRFDLGLWYKIIVLVSDVPLVLEIGVRGRPRAIWSRETGGGG